MTEMKLINNQAGGIDLIIERDAGNPFQVLTGRKENSLQTWKKLRTLCDDAIHQLVNE